MTKEKTIKRAPKNSVKTADGSFIHKDDAIIYKKAYYDKAQCILIQGIFYPKDCSEIVFDTYTNNYNLAISCMEVIIGISADEKSYVRVWCLKIPFIVAVTFIPKASSLNIIPMNEREAIDGKSTMFFFYNIKTAIECGACFGSDKTNVEMYFGNMTKSFFKEYVDGAYREFGNHLGIYTTTTHRKLSYALGIESATYSQFMGLRYTFGVEIETASGRIPNLLSRQFNWKCMRDGSVSGGEYITGILKGDAGLTHLKGICKYLNATTKTNHNCGVHVHVGNAAFNKEFTVFAYILAIKLQENLLTFLPRARRDNRFCDRFTTSAALQQSLNDLEQSSGAEEYKDRIDDIYNELYTMLSGGMYPSSSVNRSTAHPQGRYAGGSGANSYRYKWLNLLACNFNREKAPAVRGTEEESARVTRRSNIMIDSVRHTRLPKVTPNYTIEFRCHEHTSNYNIIKYWTQICMAFVYAVEARKHLILSKKIISLEDIIEWAYKPKQSNKDTSVYDKLSSYITFRKQYFATSTSSNPDLDVAGFEASAAANGLLPEFISDIFQYSEYQKHKEWISKCKEAEKVGDIFSKESESSPKTTKKSTSRHESTEPVDVFEQFMRTGTSPMGYEVDSPIIRRRGSTAGDLISRHTETAYERARRISIETHQRIQEEMHRATLESRERNATERLNIFNSPGFLTTNDSSEG